MGAIVLWLQLRRTKLIDPTSLLMLKLYKMDVSPPARACMIACELFDVPVQLIELNLFENEHLKPEFLKKNPEHTIPVLEDGSIIITDSNAILMYLADVYGKKESVYPKDPKKRVLVNQKLFFNASVLFARLRNITFPLLLEGIKGISKNNLDAVEEAYGFLEEYLSRTKYLAGNDMTIADIAAFATISSLVLLLELNGQKYPKTTAWMTKLEKVPYIHKNSAKGVQMAKELIDSQRT